MMSSRWWSFPHPVCANTMPTEMRTSNRAIEASSSFFASRRDRTLLSMCRHYAAPAGELPLFARRGLRRFRRSALQLREQLLRRGVPVALANPLAHQRLGELSLGEVG